MTTRPHQLGKGKNLAHLFIVLSAILLPQTAISSDQFQKITSYTDPVYSGHKFHSLVVYAPDVPMDRRSAVEGSAVEELARSGVRAQEAIDLVPPTRENDPSEWLKLADIGFEATLKISTERISTEVQQTPIYVIPGATATQYDVETGNLIDRRGPPIVEGGSIKKIPAGSFSVELISNSNGAVAWKGSVQIRGLYEFSLSGAALLKSITDLKGRGLI